MKRSGFLFLLVFAGGVLFGAAPRYTPAFGWAGPESLAVGGAFSANGRGFETLMHNPGSYTVPKSEKNYFDAEGNPVSDEKGEVTAFSTQMGGLLNPFQFKKDLTVDGQVQIQGLYDPQKLIPVLLNQLMNNDVGVDAMIGGGYVGKGFGMGLVTTAEARASGTSLTAARARAIATLAVPLGYAHRFDLGRGVDLSVGGSLRLMYRLHAELGVQELKDRLMNDGEESSLPLGAFHGFGVGADLGMLLQWNMLNVGIAFRDLGTTFWMNDFLLGAMKAAEGQEVSRETTVFMTPPTMKIGVGIHPDFGPNVKKWVDLKAQVEYSLRLMAADDPLISGLPEVSPWTNLGIGLEVVLFEHLALRSGFYQGYFSGGIGVDLWYVDINATFYTSEGGVIAGQRPNYGSTLEFAVRF